MDCQNIWDKVLTLLEDDFSEITFKTYIKPLVPIYIDAESIVLRAPNMLTKQSVEKRHIKRLVNKLFEVSGLNLDVEIITDESVVADDSHSYKNYAKHQYLASLSINLNMKFVFDAFVKGKSNELAYQAAVAVAEKPGTTPYNPLFMYGRVGLGKTHLMHSIGNHILKKDPSKKVLYTSSEDFTNVFINSVRYNKMPEFREKFRNVDVLLIDDIQFLSEKEGTQEELFHTFNTLYNASKQIVISSDQPPKDLNKIEDRLTSRFGNGLIVDITYPDYETRMAILEKKAELEQMAVSKDVTEFIARNIDSNIRDLEGAIIKVIALSKLNNTKITFDMAEKVLKEFIKGNEKREITCTLIQETVASYYYISVEDLLSKSKLKKLTYPRQVAMYLCRKILINITTTKIGESFNRDHSTIIHASEKINSEIEKDRVLNDVIITLEKRIRDGG